MRNREFQLVLTTPRAGATILADIGHSAFRTPEESKTMTTTADPDSRSACNNPQDPAGWTACSNVTNTLRLLLARSRTTGLRTLPREVVVECLEGEAAVNVLGKTQALKPGHTLVIPAHASYYVEGIQDESLVVESFRDAPGRRGSWDQPNDTVKQQTLSLMPHLAVVAPLPEAFCINYR